MAALTASLRCGFTPVRLYTLSPAANAFAVPLAEIGFGDVRLQRMSLSIAIGFVPMTPKWLETIKVSIKTDQFS